MTVAEASELLVQMIAELREARSLTGGYRTLACSALTALHAHHLELQQLRRQLQALREENRELRRQRANEAAA